MKAFELYVLLVNLDEKMDNRAMQKIQNNTVVELLEALNSPKRDTPLIGVIKQRFAKYIGKI
jgi:hypothetical protein